MKLLLKLVVLVVIGGAAYLYLKPGASISDFSTMFNSVLEKFSGPPVATANAATVPSSTPVPITAAPPVSKPPETIRLKNGKTVVGNVVIRDAELTMVRTADGKSVQIPTKDIVVDKP